MNAENMFTPSNTMVIGNSDVDGQFFMIFLECKVT
jgi:hypothetical protein